MSYHGGVVIGMRSYSPFSGSVWVCGWIPINQSMQSPHLLGLHLSLTMTGASVRAPRIYCFMHCYRTIQIYCTSASACTFMASWRRMWNSPSSPLHASQISRSAVASILAPRAATYVSSYPLMVWPILPSMVFLACMGRPLLSCRPSRRRPCYFCGTFGAALQFVTGWTSACLG